MGAHEALLYYYTAKKKLHKHDESDRLPGE